MGMWYVVRIGQMWRQAVVRMLLPYVFFAAKDMEEAQEGFWVHKGRLHPGRQQCRGI